MAGAASDTSQAVHSRTLACPSTNAMKPDASALRPSIQLPSHTDAIRISGVVAGLDRNVMAAATGILARKGSASSAAPAICTPGIIRNMPTNRPSATPRGTDRRVKRHSDGSSTRCATGARMRLRSIDSRVGQLACHQRVSRLISYAPS